MNSLSVQPLKGIPMQM